MAYREQQEDINNAYIIVEARDGCKVDKDGRKEFFKIPTIVSNVMSMEDLLKHIKTYFWRELLSSGDFQIYKVDYNLVNKDEILKTVERDQGIQLIEESPSQIMPPTASEPEDLKDIEPYHKNIADEGGENAETEQGSPNENSSNDIQNEELEQVPFLMIKPQVPQ